MIVKETAKINSGVLVLNTDKGIYALHKSLCGFELEPYELYLKTLVNANQIIKFYKKDGFENFEDVLSYLRGNRV